MNTASPRAPLAKIREATLHTSLLSPTYPFRLSGLLRLFASLPNGVMSMVTMPFARAKLCAAPQDFCPE